MVPSLLSMFRIQRLNSISLLSLYISINPIYCKFTTEDQTRRSYTKNKIKLKQSHFFMFPWKVNSRGLSVYTCGTWIRIKTSRKRLSLNFSEHWYQLINGRDLIKFLCFLQMKSWPIWTSFSSSVMLNNVHLVGGYLGFGKKWSAVLNVCTVCSHSYQFMQSQTLEVCRN